MFNCQILIPKEASALESLGSREVRRYLYLRTGRLAGIEGTDRLEGSPSGLIILARKDRSLATNLASLNGFHTNLAMLQQGQFLLRSIASTNQWAILLSGGDDVGTLYAAYRFVEHIGVRFYLHGDVIPDTQIALGASRSSLTRGVSGLPPPILPGLLDQPALNEVGRPLFALRGVLPFHDFSEGPDWWNRDDYLAALSQLAKLRLNFFGLHTYPESDPVAEPTTWIGLPQDIGPNVQVKWSYNASYQNTLRAQWANVSMNTSNFVFGSAQLFDVDAYGGDVMRGLCPQPVTQEQEDELFARTGRLFQEAFRYAHGLGIKTALGTHTPLTIPYYVKGRLNSLNLNPSDPTVVQSLYEGIFRRVMQVDPVDFYWLWTPERWTWSGAPDAEVGAVTNDVALAVAAASKVQVPFQLAVSGWMLGPPQNLTLFDTLLPKAAPMSALNRNIGMLPVDPNFAWILQRPKWAISWLEDDGALTMPELWSARVRQDSADALRYGCSGLIGLHWRTRMVGPALSALAQAAWDQTPWNPNVNQPPITFPVPGAVGGQWAAFPNNTISGTADPTLYQTVRYDVAAYWLPATNGVCSVTLKFCEPFYSAAGKRVFDVKIQGQTVVTNLDISARVGQNTALDLVFNQVSVTNQWLVIEFAGKVEYPAIAAIDVEGQNFAWKINCGGPAYKDYVGDWPAANGQSGGNAPPMPISDFYSDWARQQFGSEVSTQAATIFSQIDSVLPRPATWTDGPGGIFPDSRSWDNLNTNYVFVDAILALEPMVKGAGNLERFDYWLNNLLYLRTAAQLNCVWWQYNQAMISVRAATNAASATQLAQQTALPLRKQLVTMVQQVFQFLLATVTTPGEMGTVANWNQHLLPELLGTPGSELAQFLGGSLPADAQPSQNYRGQMRVIVPTVRTTVGAGEVLNLKVIILAEQPPSEASLNWRVMGTGQFSQVPLQHLARGVYTVSFPAPAQQGLDLEYFVRATPVQGSPVYFPATAPSINQTVVVTALIPAPRLAANRAAENSVQVLLDGEPATSYVFEVSTNLVRWGPVATNSTADSGSLSFPLDMPSTGEAFFRAREE